MSLIYGKRYFNSRSVEAWGRRKKKWCLPPHAANEKASTIPIQTHFDGITTLRQPSYMFSATCRGALARSMARLKGRDARGKLRVPLGKRTVRTWKPRGRRAVETGPIARGHAHLASLHATARLSHTHRHGGVCARDACVCARLQVGRPSTCPTTSGATSPPSWTARRRSGLLV